MSWFWTFSFLKFVHKTILNMKMKNRTRIWKTVKTHTVDVILPVFMSSFLPVSPVFPVSSFLHFSHGSPVSSFLLHTSFALFRYFSVFPKEMWNSSSSFAPRSLLKNVLAWATTGLFSSKLSTCVQPEHSGKCSHSIIADNVVRLDVVLTNSFSGFFLKLKFRFLFTNE